MADAILRVFRGDKDGGEEVEYRVPLEEGMVVLDAILYIQQHQASDLAVRWNCKAAKCGSCSAEVNGKPVEAPIYIESKVTAYPYPVTVAYDTSRVKPVKGKEPSVTIKSARKPEKPEKP